MESGTCTSSGYCDAACLSWLGYSAYAPHPSFSLDHYFQEWHRCATSISQAHGTLSRVSRALCMYYNFCRVHQTLRVTAVMDLGLRITFGQLRNWSDCSAYICRAPQFQVRYMNRVRNQKSDGEVIILDDRHFIIVSLGITISAIPAEIGNLKMSLLMQAVI
jgi:hypothetical protein